MLTALARDDMLTSRLIGLPVMNEAGEKIGDVDDLIMDKHGHISAVLVEVGGFLGVEEKLVAIPSKKVLQCFQLLMTPKASVC
jgi:sporulation protein YlmC with PRC-barrel domain